MDANVTATSCELPHGWQYEISQPALTVLPVLLLAALQRRFCDSVHTRSAIVFAYDVRRQIVATWVGFSVLLQSSFAVRPACVALGVLVLVDLSLGTSIELALFSALRGAGYRIGFYGPRPSLRMWGLQTAAHGLLSVCARSVSVCCAIMIVLPHATHVDLHGNTDALLAVAAPCLYFALRHIMLDAQNTYLAHYNVLRPKQPQPASPPPPLPPEPVIGGTSSASDDE